MTYEEIKDNTYKLLKHQFKPIELIFRNEAKNTLLILTYGLKSKNEAIKLLSKSGLFKLRNSIDRNWKFTLINDKNIFDTFKNERNHANKLKSSR